MINNIIITIVALVNIGVLIFVFLWFIKRLKKIEEDMWGAKRNLWREKRQSPDKPQTETGESEEKE